METAIDILESISSKDKESNVETTEMKRATDELQNDTRNGTQKGDFPCMENPSMRKDEQIGASSTDFYGLNKETTKVSEIRDEVIEENMNDKTSDEGSSHTTVIHDKQEKMHDKEEQNFSETSHASMKNKESIEEPEIAKEEVEGFVDEVYQENQQVDDCDGKVRNIKVNDCVGRNDILLKDADKILHKRKTDVQVDDITHEHAGANNIEDAIENKEILEETNNDLQIARRTTEESEGKLGDSIKSDINEAACIERSRRQFQVEGSNVKCTEKMHKTVNEICSEEGHTQKNNATSELSKQEGAIQLQGNPIFSLNRSEEAGTNMKFMNISMDEKNTTEETCGNKEIGKKQFQGDLDGASRSMDEIPSKSRKIPNLERVDRIIELIEKMESSPSCKYMSVEMDEIKDELLKDDRNVNTGGNTEKSMHIEEFATVPCDFFIHDTINYRDITDRMSEEKKSQEIDRCLYIEMMTSDNPDKVDEKEDRQRVQETILTSKNNQESSEQTEASGEVLKDPLNQLHEVAEPEDEIKVNREMEEYVGIIQHDRGTVFGKRESEENHQHLDLKLHNVRREQNEIQNKKKTYEEENTHVEAFDIFCKVIHEKVKQDERIDKMEEKTELNETQEVEGNLLKAEVVINMHDRSVKNEDEQRVPEAISASSRNKKEGIEQKEASVDVLDGIRGAQKEHEQEKEWPFEGKSTEMNEHNDQKHAIIQKDGDTMIDHIKTETEHENLTQEFASHSEEEKGQPNREILKENTGRESINTRRTEENASKLNNISMNNTLVQKGLNVENSSTCFQVAGSENTNDTANRVEHIDPINKEKAIKTEDADSNKNPGKSSTDEKNDSDGFFLKDEIVENIFMNDHSATSNKIETSMEEENKIATRKFSNNEDKASEDTQSEQVVTVYQLTEEIESSATYRKWTVEKDGAKDVSLNADRNSNQKHDSSSIEKPSTEETIQIDTFITDHSEHDHQTKNDSEITDRVAEQSDDSKTEFNGSINMKVAEDYMQEVVGQNEGKEQSLEIISMLKNNIQEEGSELKEASDKLLEVTFSEVREEAEPPDQITGEARTQEVIMQGDKSHDAFQKDGDNMPDKKKIEIELEKHNNETLGTSNTQETLEIVNTNNDPEKQKAPEASTGMLCNSSMGNIISEASNVVASSSYFQREGSEFEENVKSQNKEKNGVSEVVEEPMEIETADISIQKYVVSEDTPSEQVATFSQLTKEIESSSNYGSWTVEKDEGKAVSLDGDRNNNQKNDSSSIEKPSTEETMQIDTYIIDHFELDHQTKYDSEIIDRIAEEHEDSKSEFKRSISMKVAQDDMQEVEDQNEGQVQSLEIITTSKNDMQEVSSELKEVSDELLEVSNNVHEEAKPTPQRTDETTATEVNMQWDKNHDTFQKDGENLPGKKKFEIEFEKDNNEASGTSNTQEPRTLEAVKTDKDPEKERTEESIRILCNSAMDNIISEASNVVAPRFYFQGEEDSGFEVKVTSQSKEKKEVSKVMEEPKEIEIADISIQKQVISEDTLSKKNATFSQTTEEIESSSNCGDWAVEKDEVKGAPLTGDRNSNQKHESSSIEKPSTEEAMKSDSSIIDHAQLDHQRKKDSELIDRIAEEFDRSKADFTGSIRTKVAEDDMHEEESQIEGQDQSMEIISMPKNKIQEEGSELKKASDELLEVSFNKVHEGQDQSKEIISISKNNIQEESSEMKEASDELLEVSFNKVHEGQDQSMEIISMSKNNIQEESSELKEASDELLAVSFNKVHEETEPTDQRTGETRTAEVNIKGDKKQDTFQKDGGNMPDKKNFENELEKYYNEESSTSNAQEPRTVEAVKTNKNPEKERTTKESISMLFNSSIDDIISDASNVVAQRSYFQGEEDSEFEIKVTSQSKDKKEVSEVVEEPKDIDVRIQKQVIPKDTSPEQVATFSQLTEEIESLSNYGSWADEKNGVKDVSITDDRSSNQRHESSSTEKLSTEETMQSDTSITDHSELDQQTKNDSEIIDRIKMFDSRKTEFTRSISTEVADDMQEAECQNEGQEKSMEIISMSKNIQEESSELKEASDDLFGVSFNKIHEDAEPTYQRTGETRTIEVNMQGNKNNDTFQKDGDNMPDKEKIEIEIEKHNNEASGTYNTQETLEAVNTNKDAEKERTEESISMLCNSSMGNIISEAANVIASGSYYQGVEENVKKQNKEKNGISEVVEEPKEIEIPEIAIQKYAIQLQETLNVSFHDSKVAENEVKSRDGKDQAEAASLEKEEKEFKGARNEATSNNDEAPTNATPIHISNHEAEEVHEKEEKKFKGDGNEATSNNDEAPTKEPSNATPSHISNLEAEVHENMLPEQVFMKIEASSNHESTEVEINESKNQMSNDNQKGDQKNYSLHKEMPSPKRTIEIEALSRAASELICETIKDNEKSSGMIEEATNNEIQKFEGFQQITKEVGGMQEKEHERTCEQRVMETISMSKRQDKENSEDRDASGEVFVEAYFNQNDDKVEPEDERTEETSKREVKNHMDVNLDVFNKNEDDLPVHTVNQVELHYLTHEPPVSCNIQEWIHEEVNANKEPQDKWRTIKSTCNLDGNLMNDKIGQDTMKMEVSSSDYQEEGTEFEDQKKTQNKDEKALAEVLENQKTYLAIQKNVVQLQEIPNVLVNELDEEKAYKKDKISTVKKIEQGNPALKNEIFQSPSEGEKNKTIMITDQTQKEDNPRSTRQISNQEAIVSQNMSTKHVFFNRLTENIKTSPNFENATVELVKDKVKKLNNDVKDHQKCDISPIEKPSVEGSEQIVAFVTDTYELENGTRKGNKMQDRMNEEVENKTKEDDESSHKEEMACDKQKNEDEGGRQKSSDSVPKSNSRNKESSEQTEASEKASDDPFNHAYKKIETVDERMGESRNIEKNNSDVFRKDGDNMLDKKITVVNAEYRTPEHPCACRIEEETIKEESFEAVNMNMDIQNTGRTQESASKLDETTMNDVISEPTLNVEMSRTYSQVEVAEFESIEETKTNYERTSLEVIEQTLKNKIAKVSMQEDITQVAENSSFLDNEIEVAEKNKKTEKNSADEKEGIDVSCLKGECEIPHKLFPGGETEAERIETPNSIRKTPEHQEFSQYETIRHDDNYSCMEKSFESSKPEDSRYGNSSGFDTDNQEKNRNNDMMKELKPGSEKVQTLDLTLKENEKAYDHFQIRDLSKEYVEEEINDIVKNLLEQKTVSTHKQEMEVTKANEKEVYEEKIDDMNNKMERDKIKEIELHEEANEERSHPDMKKAHKKRHITLSDVGSKVKQSFSKVRRAITCMPTKACFNEISDSIR